VPVYKSAKAAMMETFRQTCTGVNKQSENE